MKQMIAAILTGLSLCIADTASGASVTGRVTGPNGPVTGATIRVQGMASSTATDEAGLFTLSGLPVSLPITISAWKHGFYSAMQEKIRPPASGVVIRLNSYQQHDNPRYEWLPPIGGNPQSCDKCHHKALMDLSLDDAHMKSATNHRFLNVYFGEDLSGNRTPIRRYQKGIGNWAALPVPAAYDKRDQYAGPGFLTEGTGTAGNCSGCHLPGASSSHNIIPAHFNNNSLTQTTGTDAYSSGIHCDFCHKVAAVNLDPVTNLPFPGRSGVHSMKLLRPSGKKGAPHEQLFFGPFDDPNSTTSTKLPLISQSQFCAPCHHGQFWGKQVYNSYGEWLASPYGMEGSPQFKTCQQCHMPSPVIWHGKTMTNTAPGKGGVERSPSQFRSHRMTIDQEILTNSLTMSATARNDSGKVRVDVELYNNKTGHHVPSDSPLRHLILHIEAQDGRGKVLKQLSGPLLPDWTGSSGKVPVVPAFAGKPGKAYAKLLKEKWTNEFPTAAYWNDFDIVSDNRLAAFAKDSSSYGFERPTKGATKITVSLYYRRAYYQLMEWKKWTDTDILMSRKEFTIP